MTIQNSINISFPKVTGSILVGNSTNTPTVSNLISGRGIYVDDTTTPGDIALTSAFAPNIVSGAGTYTLEPYNNHITDSVDTFVFQLPPLASQMYSDIYKIFARDCNGFSILAGVGVGVINFNSSNPAVTSVHSSTNVNTICSVVITCTTPGFFSIESVYGDTLITP